MPKTIADLAAGTISATTQIEVQNGSDGQKITGQDILNFAAPPPSLVADISVSSQTQVEILNIPAYPIIICDMQLRVVSGAGSATQLYIGNSGGYAADRLNLEVLDTNLRPFGVMLIWRATRNNARSAYMKYSETAAPSLGGDVNTSVNSPDRLKIVQTAAMLGSIKIWGLGNL